MIQRQGTAFVWNVCHMSRAGDLGLSLKPPANAEDQRPSTAYTSALLSPRGPYAER